MIRRSETGEDNLVLDKLKPQRPTFIYVVTVLSAVGGFLFGYDTGVVSGAMILLRDQFNLDYIWQELVVSITIAAAWLFSLIAGQLTDIFGRKPVIILASFVFTGGAILMGVSVNKGMLLGGRLIVGSGIGLASMTVPMYIAEVAPSDIRGSLVTINNCFITLGQFTASLVDGAFSQDLDNGWRYMLGLAAIPSFIQFFGFLAMPESPRWLISRGRYQDSVNVLRKIRGQTANIEEEFESIKSSFLETERERESRNEQASILVQVLQSPSLRRALMVGCGLQMFQQLAGINTVMYYSATIIEMSGVKNKSTIIWLSAATAGMNCFCSFVGLLFVEKVGRRLLTLVSLAGVIFSLIFLAVSFQLAYNHSPDLSYHDKSAAGTVCDTFSTCAQCVTSSSCGYCFMDMDYGPANGTCLKVQPDRTDISIFGPCNSSSLHEPLTWAFEWCPSSYSWMTLLGLLFYLLFFAPGMGPMPWTINSEIYPLWARSTCYSTATSVNWLFNLIVSMSFLTLTQALTKHGAFWLYSGIAALGWIFFFLMLPETKGKTLEEVEGLFSHPWWQDATTSDDKKTVQYVHIRGINHAYAADDSGDES